jgi:Holliday junction resolvase RusA-like endonuclease
MLITLPKPPGVNALYKITCRNGYPNIYKSAEGKAWIEEAGYKLKAQYRKKLTEDDISLYIKVYFCGRFDIDSCLKALLDLFQEMEIVKNDSQFGFLQIEKIRVPHRIDERVEIELE